MARTSTAPAGRLGATTLQLVFVLHSTPVATVEPNLNVVVPAPGSNPVPLTVTLVAPETGPAAGAREVIVGGPKLKRACAETALVLFGVATVTSTLPALAGGETVDYGCDAAQGYFFGRPVAAEHLGTWLADSPFGIRETTRS